jgi:hypothetical protein
MKQDVEIAPTGTSLDLSLDAEIFAAPGGGEQFAVVDSEEGCHTTTFVTTCWGTCDFTCGDCETISCCSC